MKSRINKTQITASFDNLENFLEEMNFTPFIIKDLKNWKVDKVVFRSEDSNREYPRSSLKIFLENYSGKVQIKQFNYDWGPPAYSCPSLWKNHIKFPEIDIPEPKAYPIGHSIVWIGFNYRNQRAASLLIKGTTIEICVTEGNISESDLIDISSSLIELDQAHSCKTVEKTYAERSFGYPNIVASINVPISFWVVPTSNSGIRFQRAFTPNCLPKKFLPRLKMPNKGSYILDSVFSYQRNQKLAEEDRVEYVYKLKSDPDAIIRVLRCLRSSDIFTVPPKADTTQKFHNEKLQIHGIDCFYAYRNKEYGPHEVFWQDSKFTYLLLAQSALWTTKDWFLNFLQNVFNINY